MIPFGAVILQRILPFGRPALFAIWFESPVTGWFANGFILQLTEVAEAKGSDEKKD